LRGFVFLNHRVVFSLVLFSVSLAFGPTKSIAEGSIERSSPEEPKPKSLPGLRFKNDEAFQTKEAWPTLIPLEAFKSDQQSQGLAGIQTAWSPGVAPYQVNPITAILAAGIVVSVQSLKEDGRIDPKALWRLFNSTDLYAGYVGAVSANSGREAGIQGAKSLAKKIAPNAFKDFGKSQAALLFGNLMNAFTYTLAVSSGFEYFSQFWRLATKDIPNVSKVSDLFEASSTDFTRVFSNLFQYVINPEIQRRILSSIKYHRVYTFDFIAMNLGLFVGVFVGDQIASRIGPKASAETKKLWSQKLTREMGRLLGGVLGGVSIQFVPETFKMRVNEGLLHWKISNVKNDLKELINKMNDYVQSKKYPPYHAVSAASFWYEGVNLQSDVHRVIRTRDLLYSLYAQKYFLVGMNENDLAEIEAERFFMEDRFFNWMESSGGVGPSYFVGSDVFSISEMSMEDLEAWVFDDLNKDLRAQHYTRVLYAGWQDLQLSYSDFEDFVVGLREFQGLQREPQNRDLRPVVSE